MRRLISILLKIQKEVGVIWLLFFCLGNCEKAFLESHWSTPIALQGKAPSLYGESEKSLDPEDCGTCHREQFEKWNESFHSKAGGSGLQWQLKRLGVEKAEDCFSCHSPLAETQAYFKESKFAISKPSEEITSYLSKGEEERGIICASCHVRKHVRYGPPPRSGIDPNGSSPHGGYMIRNEFETSEFCAHCHESPETGKRLNGKRLMETFTEWKKSEYAIKGIICQNCHMENRSHDWKGIHDPEMTKKAIGSSFEVKLEKDGIVVLASLKNTGAGHKFPTYSVPKLFLSVTWIRSGNVYRSLAEKTIGRVTDIDLETEFEDTRLAPGEEAVLTADIDRSEWKKGDKIRFQAIVEPDEFYARMFQDNYDQRKKYQISGPEELQLLDALRNVKNTRYVLFKREKTMDQLTFH
ncbi:multiheme c-type cytochrome [Leptospira stimsonii]|uniref:Cytochrome C554 and C-prime n=1 Tax=Leptospira stimsonii TaxID=2202203 RepID=A0A8B3CN51_9LEPT|nr:multiheme c-type cytochrome [Leptospira stimsonii]RHX84551.1 cytochrome C554 and C-prime [Leptospira stimsonii]